MKLKIILYIDVMYRGGAQRVMSVLAHYLIKNNYEVILITDFMPENPSKEYNLPQQIKRIYLKKNNTGNFLIKNITRVTKLRKIIKEENPDIILSFLGRPNIRMLLSSIGLKVKKVVSVRNDPTKEYGNNILKRIITNLIFLLADGYVFQTVDAQKYFIKKIQKKSKIILNPVDDKFYNMKPVKNRHNIITVGRLEPQKNHKLLLDAYAEIAQKYLQDDLIIYGDGSLKKELENYALKKNIYERVHFRGNIENIEKELSKAKVFILTSDYEGMPNALMEAMAIGVACISTDCPCGGPRALIKNNSQGIMFPCNDKNKLIAAIKKVLDGNFTEMGINAKLRAEEFRTSKIMKEWEEYLFK